MNVMVTIADDKYHDPSASLEVSVRKCPPNYKTNEHEWIIELDDYSEEDIKNYFEINTQIPDKDEEVHEC